MIRFDQRVAIVTGAGKGLGRAYAEYLAARGARVVVNNRRRIVDANGRTSADEVVSAICEAGGEAIANYDSVEDPGAGERMVEQALDTWGRLDVLINNAGVGQHRTFHKASVAEFLDIFDINFFGTLYVTHAAYARMRAAGYGRIVVSTSSAGLYGLHGSTAYAASKAALVGLIRTLAGEGRSHNVLSNAIAPYAATQLTAGENSPEFLATMRPEWVAPMLAYLASEQTRLNGEVIVAGKGAFRRAAVMEGAGIGYTDAHALTPETVARDVEQIVDMKAAGEFADAMASFNDLFQAHRGIVG